MSCWLDEKGIIVEGNVIDIELSRPVFDFVNDLERIPPKKTFCQEWRGTISTLKRTSLGGGDANIIELRIKVEGRIG